MTRTALERGAMRTSTAMLLSALCGALLVNYFAKEMECRKSAAGLSINRMLDAGDLISIQPAEASIRVKPILEPPPISQVAMPSRSIRVKPIHEVPYSAPMQLSQMAAPSMRVKPTLQDTSSVDSSPSSIPPASNRAFLSAISNVVMPAGLRVAPILEAPQSAQIPVPSAPSNIDSLPFPQPVQTLSKPNKALRPTLTAQELLKALKLWSTSLSPPDLVSAATSTSTSLMTQAADIITHTSNPVCLLTNTQIQRELKSLQELLDSGFIQPIEYETRRFQLQSLSKYAMSEIIVPNVDANRQLAPMTSTPATGTSSTTTSTQRKHIRVFVSSTFKDMAEERDTLVKNVFPQLQRECKKRGIGLTCVDLRWGITSEQTNAGNTVNICLSEIDRSQYFLCMLGSRYGWAQPIDAPPVDLGSANTAVRQDALLKKSMQLALPNYPWIRAHPSCSVTELEIRHATLNHPEQSPSRKRSLFMLRDGSVDDDSRLTALKQEICASVSSSAVKRYRSSNDSDFGSLALKSLMAMILEDFATETPEEEAKRKEMEENPILRERIPHQAFEDSRNRFFIQRESDFQALESHLASMTSKPLAVVAAQGLGKSAFLSNFASRYRSSHPERLLITHYTGCTAASTDLSNLLRRLISELWFYSQSNNQVYSSSSISDDERLQAVKEREKMLVEMPTDVAGLTDRFIELLTAAGSKYGGGVTIIIDAINQLASGASLEWLPSTLPAGTQLILSSSPSHSISMNAITRANYIVYQLRPLSPPERESFIQGFMTLHAKTLKTSQLESLVSAPACENPLYLKTLLDELRVFGSFEQLDQRIEEYLKAKDATELFKHVFSRLDRDTALVNTTEHVLAGVMSSIHTSRSGMTEGELIKMFNLTQASWSTLSLALEELLVDSGILSFFHDCVKTAVSQHYVKGKENSLHAELATFFESFPPGQDSASTSFSIEKLRYYEELPFHYEQSGNWTKLQAFITNATHFKELARNASFRYDLYRYWRALPSNISENTAKLLSANLDAIGKAEGKQELYDTAALFFKDIGQYQQAEALYTKSILMSRVSADQLMKSSDTKGVSEVADRLEQLGYVFRLAGKYSDASRTYRLALSARRHLYKGLDSQFLATSINSLAILCRKQGNYTEASSLYHEALDMRKRLFGQVHVDIAQSYNSLGCLLQDQGRYEEASRMLLEAVRQRETLLGKSHPDVAMSLLNLGNVYLDWSKYTDAEPIYERALAIYEATFGPEHPNVALVLNSFGGLYQEMGKFEKALPMYVRNLETKIKMIGEKHPDLALAYNDIAVLCSRRDNNALAEDFFNGALKIRQTVLGEKHPDFAQSLQNLGSIYQQDGYYDMALPLFKRSLKINEEAFGDQHPNVASACTSIGGLLQLMGSGHFAESVAYYKRAYGVYSASCANGKPDSDLALTCNDMAIVYVKMGQFKDAEEMYLEALKHYSGCFGPDHPDVAQALKNLGSFYTNPSSRDKAKALQYLEQSVQVFQATLGASHARTVSVMELIERVKTM